MASRHVFHYFTLAAATASLMACGGGSSSNDNNSSTGGGNGGTGGGSSTTSAFTKKATWQFTLPAAGESVCFDFDAGAQRTCSDSDTTWDVKVLSGGRSAELFTNSGPSGSGQGAAFGGPFVHTWADLQRWNNALIDPDAGALPAALYVADSANSVFTGDNDIRSAAFEYDLNGTRQLHPNFRVFVLTTNASATALSGTADKPVYALQVTGYYGGPTGTASGWPSIRWIDMAAPTNVMTATVDASADWVYYDLANKATTSASGNWHIAFNRYQIKLNGGASGNGGMAGFLSKTPAGFYAADGSTPNKDQFNLATNLQDTQADLTGVKGALTGPSSANGWVKDSVGSQLTPSFQGSYPNPLDFGWYRYYPTEAAAQAVGLGQHQLQANPNAAALLRSGEGNSYARMRLASINYATATPAHSGAQTWTFEFEVQPSDAGR